MWQLVRRHGDDGDMDDMDMGGMDMAGSSSSSMTPLSADGVDFSNETQAMDFLGDLLDDTYLKIDGANYAKYFWYGIVVVVGIATLFNFARWLTLQQRLRAAARGHEKTARPKGILAGWLATITAIGREASYLQFTPTTKYLFLRIPTFGTILLVSTYLAFIIALEFADNNVAGAQYLQGLGVRAGWLAVAQLPLLVLLINKNSIIGSLTGTSWERLNVLHRWVARGMLLLAIFHFGFQSTAWQKYHVMELEWKTDDCPPTGIAAFAILLWMNLSTLAPLRYLSYEFFVVQHILTWFGFVVALMFHLPSTALSSRVYVYIPIGIYLADRILRSLMLAWNNLRVSRATMVQLDGGVTKLRISNKAIKRWRPGSHVLLSIPRFGIMQSHPATIVSTPKSHNGDLVFMLKGHKGFTKKIFSGANTSTEALIAESKDDSDVEKHTQVSQSTHIAIIDGPYGGSQSDFAAFDSICLIAGSTGVTFTTSILQDLADRVSTQGKKFPLRRVHFVWCVKDSNWAHWISDELEAAYTKLQSCGIYVKISVYVTCADKFTETGNEPKECGCECDKSKGPCCCVVVDEDDEGEAVDAITPAKEAANVAETSASSSQVDLTSGRKMPFLRCATFYSGRPDVREVLETLVDGADGESGVAVCGPTGLITTTRNTLVRISDERAIHKGTGAQGCYLHAETFS
ncbi:Ferric/cupric reductase transmembrane component 7 [Pseudocercospora fuligena]|uniref:Ferric/cupric reductase transmembrane component 7 n=1 Tax=Pseudocercospora fuligena TaxID=685502 RepID=A0A8H6RCC1_9PEZI|nr:Ferric/cupric reductase transmembrane component 7 [Pseudocercospora fuligena]